MAERLPPTSLMGEWSIEVRRESACLIGTGYANHLVNNRAEPRHTPRMLRGAAGSTAFAIPAEDVGKVVAALDQVLGHPGYAKYSADHPPRTRLWTTPGFHDDLIPLHGPVILLGSRIPWAVTDSVELPYDTVADLRDRIATFASPGVTVPRSCRPEG
jgi:hypothetical protein